VSHKKHTLNLTKKQNFRWNR